MGYRNGRVQVSKTTKAQTGSIFQGWRLFALFGGALLLLVGGFLAVPNTLRLLWVSLHLLPQIGFGILFLALGVFLVRLAWRR
jgi:hypothetical protein